MATLTQSQIYTIALLTGLPNPRVMAAVAMAESSGRTDVVNSIGCVGLWQINQPVHVKSHPKWTVAYLQNPVNNAFAAKEIYSSQGLRAWEAYTNGAYAKYLSQSATDLSASDKATQASWNPDDWLQKKLDDWLGPRVRGPGSPEWDEDMGNLPGADDIPSLGGGIDLSALSDIAEGVYGLTETMQKAGAWLSKGENWVRIAYVAGGALVVGMALFSLSTPGMRKAMSAGPQGRVLKTVTRAARAPRAAAARRPAGSSASSSARSRSTTRSSGPSGPRRKDVAV